MIAVPFTITEALERDPDDRLLLLQACLYRLAVAFDDPTVPAQVLASLSRVIRDLLDEIDTLEFRRELEAEHVADEPFSPRLA